jgi:LmbE family N-acetylglucosaminyl deacetylase
VIFEGDQTVLVVGTHPDDEVLGAGGTIARHAAAGDEVHVLIVTEGATQQYDNEELVKQKREDAQACADQLGVAEVHFGNLPDMRLDDVAHVEVNAAVETVCENIKPDIVYTHSNREVNQDHVAVHDSTVVATRPSSGVSTILGYETPSSTEWTPGDTLAFNPNVFVDISNYVETKVEAFESYESEVREYPHPRSAEALRALAKTRGVASGFEAAEGFQLLRTYQ